jgi:hypothetical protein
MGSGRFWKGHLKAWLSSPSHYYLLLAMSLTSRNMEVEAGTAVGTG